MRPYDIIFQIGLIALEFARLENALNHCLFSIAKEDGVGVEVRKTKPYDGFTYKLTLLLEWAPWYMETCKVKSPFQDLDGFLNDCKKLAYQRNHFVHSMALYYIEDFDGEGSKRFQFLQKENREDFFGDWVDATHKTLEQMRDLQRKIENAGDLMQNLSMTLSHADNRIQEFEEAMGFEQRK